MAKNKVTIPSVPHTEAEWRAKDDARMLAEAQVILKDPKRLKAAAKAAEGMAKDKEIEARAMKKIARKG
jgi:hypothetical protein